MGECEIVKTIRDSGYMGLIVHGDYRRKGLASNLFRESVAKAKAIGINRLQAEVGVDNIPAQNFFSKIGFVRHGKSSTVKLDGVKFDVMLLEKSI